MSEEILEEGVLIGNPIDGWKRVVEIQKGHGLTDITCRHGSRWIWNPLCIPDPCWMQVVCAPGCDCGAPPKPYKIQVSRIRKPYFDAIVSGEKGEELKALSPYWIKRLFESEIPPNVMKFVCGKRVHSRKITRIFTEKAENILRRPVSEQGKKDLQLDEHEGYCMGYCIVVELGEEVKA